MTVTLHSPGRTPFGAAPAAATLRRGACPSLASPMRTGDGLLVRLRPVLTGLRPLDYVVLARLAAAHGNGLIEVTARGNLQIRGLREETVPLLAYGLATACITFHRGVAVETPPLSGVDPAEVADAEPLAAAIRTAITAHEPALTLAPKLSIVVDGGGRLNLADMVADIRLDATRPADRLLWRLSVGGDARTARMVAIVADGDVVAATLVACRALDAMGSAARGRDLNPGALRLQLGSMVLAGGYPSSPAALSPIGLHPLTGGAVFGIGLAYGQTSAAHLEALMLGLEALGATEIRLSPHRALLVLGLSDGAIENAKALAEREGFWTRADEPGNAIAVCAGAAGCASGHFDTRTAADLLVTRVPDLLDGSLNIHVSGCAKGCAHPRAAALTLVGQAGGIGLVVDGRAGDAVETAVAAQNLDGALARIAALLKHEGKQGETARRALERIGVSDLSETFQQGRQ